MAGADIGEDVKDLDKPIYKSKKFLAVMISAGMMLFTFAIQLFGMTVTSKVELVIAGAYAAAVNAAVLAQGMADANGARANKKG